MKYMKENNKNNNIHSDVENLKQNSPSPLPFSFPFFLTKQGGKEGLGKVMQLVGF